MKNSLQVPEVARPRAFRLKDHPSVIIFRDRSVLRDEERRREVSAPRYAVKEKRSDERSKERRPVGGSRAEPRHVRANRNRQSGDRSERLLGFGQCLATANFSSPCGRTTVTFFRSKAERILSSEASLPSRRVASRDVQFPGTSVSRGKYSHGSFPNGVFTGI